MNSVLTLFGYVFGTCLALILAGAFALFIFRWMFKKTGMKLIKSIEDFSEGTKEKQE
jgi:hypothetical protein